MTIKAMFFNVLSGVCGSRERSADSRSNPFCAASEMARAHRFFALVAVLSTLYFLALTGVIPVPFLPEDIMAQLLPVVRASSP